MSGSTKLFNIPANTLRPGPRLVIVRQPTGLTTATMDFTCRKFDVGKPVMQAKLVQGTPLLDLYPEAGTDFDYLYLLDWTSQDEPGGITTVSCNFSGVDVSTTDFTFESSIIYTRNNALRDEPIWTHPQVIVDLSNTEIEALQHVVKGTAYKSSDGAIRLLAGDQILVSNANTGAIADWYALIVIKGYETYLKATSEWTKSATGRGKLPSSSFTDFGYIDSSPPGSPSAPAGETWLYSGATESISVTGDGANSYSQTWISGTWPAEIYTAP